MAFSLFRANVPIGEARVGNQTVHIYPTREFVQALTSALRGLGGEGSDAVSFELRSTGVSFTFDDPTDTTANSPDSITFTAELTNMTGTASFTATAYDDSAVSLGTITLGGSGNTRTLTKEQFNSLGDLETQYVVVAATLGSYSDSVTVHRADLTGLTGNRGSRTIYAVDAAYVSTYDIDGPGGIAAGADSYKAKATLLIAAATASETPTTPIQGDEVVFSNGSTYVYTVTNDGTYATTGNASWDEPGIVIDGNVLVNGSVTAAKVSVNNLAALSALLGNVTIDSSGSLKGGQTDYATGTGFFLGYSGSAYKFSIGSSTSYMRWTGTALDILSTGAAVFDGSAASAGYASATGAIVANESGNADNGIISYSQNLSGLVGILKSGGLASGQGVLGKSNKSGRPGVRAEGNAGSLALEVVGTMTIDNSTLVSNLNAEKWNGATLGSIGTGASTATFDGTAKPGSNSTNTWVSATVGGTTYYWPVWT